MDLPMPPPNYDTQAPGLVICASIGIGVSVLAVLLRFWSRVVAISTLSFWWDDWAMIGTLASSTIFLSLIIYWTSVGLGTHTWMVDLSQVKPNALANLVALVFYFTTIYMIKISALLLYARVFKISRLMRIALWSVAAFVTVWWVISCITTWMFCHPIRKMIDPFVEGTCDTATSWYLSSAFINAFNDLVVLVLPLPSIWTLQMSLYKRVTITLMFLVGYCSAFLSFARFIVIARNPNMLQAGAPTSDPSWDLVPLLFLSMLEAPLAIIALCGPSINALALRAVKTRSLLSLFNSRNINSYKSHSKGSSLGRSGSSRDERFSKLSNHGVGTSNLRNEGGHNSTTAIATEPGRFGGHADSGIPLGSIGVSRDVKVARSGERDMEIV